MKIEIILHKSKFKYIEEYSDILYGSIYLVSNYCVLQRCTIQVYKYKKSFTFGEFTIIWQAALTQDKKSDFYINHGQEIISKHENKH
jgi:hypothetical protein